MITAITTLILGSIPLAGFILTLKLKKNFNEGRLTSISAWFKSLPILFQFIRLMFVEKVVKKNYYLNQQKVEIFMDGYRLCDNWTARETDVIVAIQIKSGTTWMQQICQQLRVKGDNTNVNYYQDIHDVQPWIESRLHQFFGPDHERPIQPDPAAGPGATDMDADHVDSSIRVYKSHLTYQNLKGTNCKQLYMYRKCVDVLYSLFYFMMKIYDLEGKVKPHDFITQFLYKSNFMERNLVCLCDFWEHRHEPHIGVFFYHDLKQDHAGSVKQVADFIGIETTPKLIEKVVEQSSVKFMSSDDHHQRFDGFTNHAVTRRGWGLDISQYPKVSGQKPLTKVKSIKVTKGSEHGKRGSEEGRTEVEACYRKTWDRIVLPRTGFANLDEMRAAWKKERSI